MFECVYCLWEEGQGKCSGVFFSCFPLFISRLWFVACFYYDDYYYYDDDDDYYWRTERYDELHQSVLIALTILLLFVRSLIFQSLNCFFTSQPPGPNTEATQQIQSEAAAAEVGASLIIHRPATSSTATKCSFEVKL
eukprot:gene9382-6601_t